MFVFFVFLRSRPATRQPSLHCQLHTLCMYMYSILLLYCFLLKFLSTNTVGDSSVPTVTRLVAIFGRFLTFRTLPQLDSNWYNNIALKYHVYSHPQVL